MFRMMDIAVMENEKMAEYIDRQAAIDAIRKDMYADKDYMSALICDGIEDVLKSLPSANVQPVIPARWEIGTGFRWRCSVCGGLTYIPSKFCFNCGARMDGEKDG